MPRRWELDDQSSARLARASARRSHHPLWLSLGLLATVIFLGSLWALTPTSGFLPSAMTTETYKTTKTHNTPAPSRTPSDLTRIASAGALALGALTLAPPAATEAFAQQGCTSDVTGNGQVDGADLAQILNAWGPCLGEISAVTPGHGSTLGGTLITINGFNLAGTTAVKIGGVACTSLQVLSPTLVKAVTPAGEVGDGAITLISASGVSWAPVPFSYVLQAISSVTPSQGTYSGGTAITITGSYLSGATSVKVGGVPATSVVAVDATTVTAVTPAGSVGAATVEVTTPKGTATASGAFNYTSVVVPGWATLIEAMPDPAVVTNETLRAGIIATGLAWRVRDTGTNIEMLLVPPGTFMMGCSASSDEVCDTDEDPVHQVTLTNAVYFGRYEVTQAQWVASMGSNPSYHSGAGYPDAANRPVEMVSWNSVQDFLAAAGLRLPTEAEWEWSCRAGTTTAFHSGPGFPNGSNDASLAGQLGWTASNSGGQTHAVGGKAANALGFHDMVGNVWEWVSDWWGSFDAASQTDPTGPTVGSYHTSRGTCWWDGSLRVSHRIPSGIGTTLNQVFGFRVARNP